MRGITPNEYADILSFIQRYHKFTGWRTDAEREHIRKTFPNMKPEYGMNIKYVESSYDTRYGDIWSISFRSGSSRYSFRENSLVGYTPERTWEFDTLYGTVMAFLKGELKNSEYFIETEVERG